MEIIKQLDPVMETAILMLLGLDAEKMKEEYIDELSKVDIDGKLFYETYLTEYEKYLQSFMRNRVSEPDDVLFTWEDFEFNQFAVTVFAQIPNFINKIDSMSKEELQHFMVEAYNEIYETEYPISENPTADEIMTFISETEFTDSAKWQFATLLHDPKPFYKQCCSMIENNIPAFEKTCEECKSYIEQGIQYFEENVVPEDIGGEFKRFIPMAALPISLFMIEDNCYYGFYWKAIAKPINPDGLDPEELTAALKAISDKSRLEILFLLKGKPMYSQEIAETLGVTPATISHHMNNLIVRNLVTLEKYDGRGYFHLNQKGIKTVIKCLERKLL